VQLDTTQLKTALLYSAEVSFAALC
jgi:hypothetical protein